MGARQRSRAEDGMHDSFGHVAVVDGAGSSGLIRLGEIMRNVTGLVLGGFVLAGRLAAVIEVNARGGEPDPVGLDLTFTDGAPDPIAVIAGETFYIDSFTVMTEVHGEQDELLDELRDSSMLAELDWNGLQVERQDWIAEFDGTYQLQRYFHNAGWMGGVHRLQVTLWAGDELLADPLELETADVWPPGPRESFATRRFSTMTFAHGAAEEGDTTGAEFSAQAWLQLRNGVADDRTFVIPAEATHLRVEWDHLPEMSFDVPLEPVSSSPYAYGFDIEVDPIPPADGVSYAPGQDVTFNLAFVDGQGTRLHPRGSLPTYGEFMSGEVTSGLQYYNFFPGIIFYRDKNREGVLLASLTGPEHLVHQTHEAVPTVDFLTQNVQIAAAPEAHGFSSLWAIVPPSPIVFGSPDGWDTPVPDHLTFRLPDDAGSGSYAFAIKARRLYRGEESLATRVVRINVGTPPLIENAVPLVGNCDRCHKGAFSLARMLHHVDDVTVCTGCHLPLGFEENNLLPHRIHRIHALSDRYKEDPRDCTVCHLHSTPEVVDSARYLVCTGCHSPRETHEGYIPRLALPTCADSACHHTFQTRIHILDHELTPPPAPGSVLNGPR
jgi:predicted CXXCH cytochrome family protein